LQKVERSKRRRGALGPLLCVAALGSWLNSGAAYALEVPPEATLHDESELLPITLNAPGESLVFGGANEKNCISLAKSAAIDGSELDGEAVEDAAELQLDAVEPVPGTNGEQEEALLEANANGPCIPVAMPFAAAGEPVLAANAAASGLGFSAMLGQIAALAAIPAAIAAVGKGGGGGGGGAAAAAISPLPGGVSPTALPPVAGAPTGNNGKPPVPTPEPTSILLFAAGAALVGRTAFKRREHR
jgi:hypothetical protein